MRNLSPINIDYKEKKFLTDTINDAGYNNEVKKICSVLLLYNKLMDIKKIEDAANVKRRTIFYYVAKYRKNKRFMIDNYSKRKKTRVSDLDKFELKIADSFAATPIYSYKEATSTISKLTGISISEVQVRNFLIKHDFYKNKDGNYVQKNTDRVKKIKEKLDNSYLNEHKQEIIDFIDRYTTYNDLYSPYEMIKVIREKFPQLKTADNILIKFIVNNSSYF